MWHPEAGRGGTQTKGSEGFAGPGEEEGMVRSIHRTLSEPGMGTSAPTILRVAGVAMAASQSSPAEAAGRRVLSGEVGECFEQIGALWERKGGDDDAVRHFLGSPDLSIWASSPLFSWSPDSFLWPPAETGPKSIVHNT
jgi:hypothetical protein